MKLGPFFAVLLALLFVIDQSVAEPKKSEVDAIPAGVRVNPRFYGRSNQQSSSSNDVVVEDDNEDEDDDEEEEDADKEIEAYYSVSDNSGQTYLIPENVLQVMADKQSNNDDSETVLVPNGSIDLNDEDSEETDSDNALIMNQDSDEDNELQPSPQFITIVNDPNGNFKSPYRVARRRGVAVRRRRVGGRRRRRTRGGARKGLIRRVSRRRIRRGGGSRGGRRGGGRRGNRVKLGRVRLRPNRRGVRFGF